MNAAAGVMPNTVTLQLEPITLSSMMIRVGINDYEANTSDSLAQSLAESEGSGSVTSGLTKLPPNDPLCEYQTIENLSRIVRFFRMHLVTKKKSTDTKKVGDLENNLMAASWPMYQCFHGIRTFFFCSQSAN